MTLKEWNLTENFNLEELNDNFSFLDEKIETTNSNLVDTNEELALKASQSDLSNLATVVANHAKWSTTEEVVIGTFNGKPLYRVAVLVPNLPSSAGTTAYTHNIANIAYVLKYHAMYTNGSNFFQEENLTSAISTLATKTNIQIGVNTNRSTYSGTIWLEYTKTTD